MKQQKNNFGIIEEFYNKESGSYAHKRYEGETQSYTQYFFKKRLELLIDCIRDVLPNDYVRGKLSVIEDGCADGVVIREIERRFPGVFGQLIGLDIAPLMIEKAKRANNNPRASFFVKDNGQFPPADMFLAIGFLCPPIFDEEFHLVENKLKSGGYFICSLPSRYSFHARFKLSGRDYVESYLSYREYEKVLCERFVVEKKIRYGLFVPKLWTFPSAGKFIQPLVDMLFRHIFGDVFHECIYVLRKKS